ncbi:MAG: cytochrome c3 family protein [Nitrospirota bacterium]
MQYKIHNTLILVVFIFVTLIFNSVDAKVTGPCANCHTMHNSQDGSAVAYDFDGTSFTKTTTPKSNLLIYNCLGCHTGINTATTTTPYVFSLSEPTFGVNTLSGGNFYWVRTDDIKGHNVFSDNSDGNLSKAPGDIGFYTCGTNSCHANIHGTASGTGFSNLNERQGCTKCHMVTTNGYPTGYHHANDGTGTKYVDSATKGWFRFLAGHITGNGYGVVGIEDGDWQYTKSDTDHNEYLGSVVNGNYGFVGLGNTMTGYCTGCHGVYHQDQQSGGNWIRHPSDSVLPNSGEYAAISTTYNPNVPVARPDTFLNSLGNTPNSTVQADRDMVMCLSCHVAHGSPYDDLLRWDYSSMIAGGGSNETGCFACHTQKDTNP